MIDHILLQPEGVLPVEGAGGMTLQAYATHGSQILQMGGNSLTTDFVDDHPPPPPPK